MAYAVRFPVCFLWWKFSISMLKCALLLSFALFFRFYYLLWSRNANLDLMSPLCSLKLDWLCVQVVCCSVVWWRGLANWCERDESISISFEINRIGRLCASLDVHRTMVFFFVSKYVCVNTIFDFVRQYVVLSVLATIFQNCLFIILGDNSYREGPKCIEWNEWTVYFREKNNKRTELKVQVRMDIYWNV